MERRAFLQTGLALGVAGIGGLAAMPPPARAVRLRRSGVLRLSSNENPLGLAPTARQAVLDGLAEANRYPGASREAVIEALATKHGVPTESIVLGAGSTEVLQIVVQATATGRTRLILADPTFEDVPWYSEPEPYLLDKVPLTDQFAHDIDRMRELAHDSTYPVLVYICNPNNPTGTLTSCAAIDAWIESAPENVHFMIDEAYYEYADDPAYWSSVKWIAERRNVIVVRTFSKIYGMAGMRLGYGMAHPDTVKQLYRFGSSNSANHLALVAGLASLRDSGLVQRSLETNARARSILYDSLDELDLEYLPSHTNFVMHRINSDLDTYIERMREHDIRVGRPFPPMLSYNRISIGLPEEMERFTETLRMFRRSGWV